MLVLELGLENKVKTAMRFSLAVAIVEYPYAWIAVEFEQWITSSPIVLNNFQLLGATVMTAMGLLSLWSLRNPSSFSVKFKESGFGRGFILSLLNPQAIPFWIAITAYLKMEGWLDLSTSGRLHSYLLGTSVGVMLLLAILAIMAQKVSVFFQNNRIVRLIPGGTLLVLGLVGFYKYLSIDS